MSAAVAVLAPAVRVVVVDPRRLLRDGLRDLLATELGWPVMAASVVPPDSDSTTVVVAGDDVGDLAEGVGRVDLRGAADVASVVRAIRVAASQGTHPRTTTQAVPVDNPLTPRERSVLRAVSDGTSAAQIGRDLGISPRTVERHKQSVMAKLGAPNQAHAVARSIELRLLP